MTHRVNHLCCETVQAETIVGIGEGNSSASPFFIERIGLMTKRVLVNSVLASEVLLYENHSKKDERRCKKW